MIVKSIHVIANFIQMVTVLNEFNLKNQRVGASGRVPIRISNMAIDLSLSLFPISVFVSSSLPDLSLPTLSLLKLSPL